MYSFAFSLSMPLQSSNIKQMAADTTMSYSDISPKSILIFPNISILTCTICKPKICLCPSVEGHKTAKEGKLRMIPRQGMIQNLQYINFLLWVGV
jgi:hypothetical protein